VIVAAVFAPVFLGSIPTAAAADQVAVYPLPGSQYNLPQTQITFRGLPAAAIGPVSVVGSATGSHSGQIEADSDGDGGSFVPDQPFAPGETVVVSTQLGVQGAQNGSFSFRIEQPGPVPTPAPIPVVAPGATGVQHFVSRPDLLPASITVTQDAAPISDGDIFVAPQFGPLQDGPMILDPDGQLVWFDPFPVGDEQIVTDFREQNLGGQPVLTWWQGTMNEGSGLGHGMILDGNYRQIATVYAGNGLQMDLHEFLVEPGGQAYIIAASPVMLPGVSRPVMDSVVQEIDIPTGLVLFEWHALDHIPLSDSYEYGPSVPGHILDPFHVNSISLDGSGNLIVSARNTSAVYDVDHVTGQVLWTLGGKNSSFQMGAGTTTMFQHDAVMQPDGTVTLFDDGAGPPRVHPYSRAIRVALDSLSGSATLVSEYDHAPNLSANFEGSAQLLPSGDVFIGWGQQPYFSETDSNGTQDFDAHFTAPTASYRAYRFAWSGEPLTQPDVAVQDGASGLETVYVSWNGATDVARWRVLAGLQPTVLQPVSEMASAGFETAIPLIDPPPYLEVQALSSSGAVLASSAKVDGAQSASPAGSAPRCPRASGSLSAHGVGLLALGMKRARADRLVPVRAHRRYQDFFCLTPIGLRAGYPSPAVLDGAPLTVRDDVTGRIVWLSTSNPGYAFHGVRPGTPIRAAGAALGLQRPFRVGANQWYVVPRRSITLVLKVRHDAVQEIGIADPRLTRTRSAQLRFLTSFG
jgi:hypothetical protein